MRWHQYRMDVGDAYVVDASSIGQVRSIAYLATAGISIRFSVANQAVWPDPVDMFNCAAGLLEHDVSEACIVTRGGSVGDGKVLSGVIAVQKYGDVMYLCCRRVFVWRQANSTVVAHVERDLEKVWKISKRAINPIVVNSERTSAKGSIRLRSIYNGKTGCEDLPINDGVVVWVDILR